MANLDDLIVKPGPVTGSQRPTGAPNAGSLGGRPPSAPSGGTASPMEKLASELPVATPPTPGVLPGPGQAAPAGGAMPGGQAAVAPAPVASPPGGAGITINVGGAQQPAPGPQGLTEYWPEAQRQAPDDPRLTEYWPEAQGEAAPAPAPQPTAPAPPIEFQRLPFDDELAMVPEGSVVRTPWGEGRVQGGSVRDYALTPAGKEAYGRAMIREVENFGAHPWKGDPGAPAPPVEPGRPSFNPFAPGTSAWRGLKE